MQVCQERIIICVHVQLRLLQLFRSRLVEKRGCSAGLQVRASFLPLGYGAALRPVCWVFPGGSMFVQRALIEKFVALLTPFLRSSFLQHVARVVNAGKKRLSEAGEQRGDEMQSQGWGQKLKRGEVKKSGGGGGGGKWS